MADLALTASQISRVNPASDVCDYIFPAVAITAGQVISRDANGKGVLADGSTAVTQTRLLALEDGAVGGPAISCLQTGGVSGFTITQAYDAPLFQSDTAGAIADAAGTVSMKIGIVKNSTDGSDLTKYLHFDPFLGGDQ